MSPNFRKPSTGGPLIATCKVCWARVRLKADRVELVESRAYYRCPQCEASFLVRWNDAIDLGVVAPDDPPAT